MRKWMNVLFYFICFLLLTKVIYHLAFCIPPQPEELGYDRYRICSAGIALVIASMTVGGAVLSDWLTGEERT